LTVLLSAIALAAVPQPRRILDFGAGAGRVTRWLQGAFADSHLHACDVRAQDTEFLRGSLGVESSTVAPDVESLTVPDGYDLIWVGSVVTHLSEPAARALVQKLLAACNPGGLLAISFHGRFAFEQQERGVFHYIHGDRWQEIRSGYSGHGYGYADYLGQDGYGVSMCSAEWFLRFAQTLAVKLVLLGERAWDGHHDVIVMQRT
jgi:SAM-dependent methyltransferase